MASWYPNSEYPAIGDFIQRQATASALLVDIKVLCFVASGSVQNIEINHTTHKSSLEEVIVYYPDADSKPLSAIRKKYYYLRAVISGLKKVHTLGWRPDILHLYILFPQAWLALLYHRWYRTPLIVSEQATHYSLGSLHLSRLSKAIGRAVTSISKRVVVVCKSLGDSMQDAGYKGTFSIISNVVDFGSIQRKFESKFRQGETFRWIHASTLITGHKNVEGLLRVIKRLLEAKHSIQLTLLGGSKRLNQFYMEEARLLGLEEVVIFLDEVPHKEALTKVAQYDAMVHFSNCETFGLSVLEALRLGIPVIATDTGVFDHWIDERSGVIVPVKDEQALYEGMIKMMNNYAQYDTAHIAERMDHELSTQAIGKSIHELYVEILEHPDQ